MTANATRRRTVFAGTPDFAILSLERLHRHAGLDVVAVYTQPDRRAGRGRQPQPGPVKRTAETLGIPVAQPISLKDAAALAQFAAFKPDLLVVAAYGLLLPAALLDVPRLSLNVHASLLPRWRGAAPIQRAIMAGDNTTGISMMRVVEALDAGPVLRQCGCEISASDTGGTLHDKLAQLGADCLEQTVNDFLADRLVETAQDESRVTYAAKLATADRELDWREDAPALARRVRALNPSPVATCTFGDTRVKIWEATALEQQASVDPGEIEALDQGGIDLATGNGVLRLTRLQPPGKRPISAAEFINGFHTLLAD